MNAKTTLDQDARIHPAIRAAYEAGTLTVAPYEDLYSRAGIAIPLGQAAPVLLLTPSSPYRSVAGRAVVAPLAPPPQPPAQPAGDGTMTPMFNSAEHEYLGDMVKLTIVGQSGQPVALGSANFPVNMPNGLQLQFGQILALAGDFYGCITTTTTVVMGPDGPQTTVNTVVQEISDAADPAAAFQQAFNSLSTDPQAKINVPKILAVMTSESNVLTNAALSGSGVQPSSAYTPALDLDDRYNVASGGGSAVSDKYPEGTYFELAEVNWDHFGNEAVFVYVTGHALAIQQALSARQAGGTIQARDTALLMAYALDAFACHFLTDSFASGHMRTPRKQLYLDGSPSTTGSFCALHMHNEDNYFGLMVKNAKGQSWRAFGDARVLDTVNSNNRTRTVNAVQESVGEVWTAFNSGQVPSSYAALQELPVLSAFGDYTDTKNSPALFYYTRQDGSGGYTRDKIPDLTSYDWDYYWTAASTLSEIKYYDGDGYGGYTPPLNTIKPPGSSCTVGRFQGPAAGGVWSTYVQVRYAVSFVDMATGNESELGPWGAWAFFGGRQSQPLLSGIPVCVQPISGANFGRRIYRMFQNGSAPPGYSAIQFTGQVSDNTTVTFTDSHN